MRYHSLAVSGPIGPEGRVTAWTDDGVVMGIEHRSRPMWGVQFHPESIATEHGGELFENFYALARHHQPPRPRSAARARSRTPAPRAPRRADAPRERRASTRCWRALARGRALDRAAVRAAVRRRRARLLAGQRRRADARWRSAPSSAATMGADRCVLEYDVQEKAVTSHRARRDDGRARLDLRRARPRARRARVRSAPQGSPRGLLGGFVGYLGYECKADCGSPNVHRSDVPDAVLMLANRVVAVDHVAQRTHLVALVPRRDEAEAERWLDEAEAAVRDALCARTRPRPRPTSPRRAGARRDRRRSARRDVPLRARTRAVPRRHRPLPGGAGRGRVLRGVPHRPDLDRREPRAVRALPPAAPPQPGAVRGLPEARRAGGARAPRRSASCRSTASAACRRARSRARRRARRTPRATRSCATSCCGDEKTFAEHLMIVDLLRNDLGRVCEVDTVRVPEFMVVEPYTTVHQLISTITGVLERRAHAGGMRARVLPRRLDDGRAEAAHDGHHRRHRARGARRLLGRDRLLRARRQRRPQHRDPHDRDAPRGAPRSARAARS